MADDKRGDDLPEALVEAVVNRLEARGLASDGSRLLDLMKAERNLEEALRVIRQQIEAIINAASVPRPGE